MEEQRQRQERDARAAGQPTGGTEARPQATSKFRCIYLNGQEFVIQTIHPLSKLLIQLRKSRCSSKL